MNSSTERALDTILFPVKERFKDPFMSSFILFESIWNFEVFLFVFDFSLTSNQKINFIKEYANTNGVYTFVFPLTFTLIYYFVYLPIVLPWLAAFKRRAEVKQSNLLVNEDAKFVTIESRLAYSEKLLKDELQKNSELSVMLGEKDQQVITKSQELQNLHETVRSLSSQINQYASERDKNNLVKRQLRAEPVEPVSKQFDDDDFLLALPDFYRKYNLSPKKAFEAYCSKLEELAKEIEDFYPRSVPLQQLLSNVRSFSKARSEDSLDHLRRAYQSLNIWISNHNPADSDSLKKLKSIIETMLDID